LPFQDSQPEEPNPSSVQRSYLRKCGIEDETQLAALPSIIEQMNDVKSPRGWWSHAYANGTLPACIADAKPFVSMADIFGAGPSTSSRSDVYDVPWCTSCDGRNTRRVYVGTGHDLRSNPCPTCSPFRQRAELAYDGRRVSTEREMDAWNAKPSGHKPYRNEPNADYTGDLGAPTGPEKDYGGDL
jgi:hypothetical protein